MVWNFWKRWKPESYPPILPPIGSIWQDLRPINLDKIELVDFPVDQYFPEEYKKKQIVLHHTVSGPSVRGDLETWIKDKRKIATCIIIDGGGVPYQLFSSKYWAGHLGAGNSDLDKHSIGIEIDNWGWLKPTSVSNHWQTFYGNIIKSKDVIHYTNGFRGYEYYERYKNSQLRTLGELLLYWNKRYDISLKYHEDMWDVSQRALSGTEGIWSHVSYRPASEKTDVHPQHSLITMLKTLDSLT